MGGRSGVCESRASDWPGAIALTQADRALCVPSTSNLTVTLDAKIATSNGIEGPHSRFMANQEMVPKVKLPTKNLEHSFNFNFRDFEFMLSSARDAQWGHDMTKPNILIFMVDQLNGTLFPDGPADWLHAPHLKALAARSTRFQNAYTASPLCAPGRASFMSGQLPSRTGVYDNAAEFASSIPTYAHHLRRAGYYTCLSGKMHFVGPDQLHGFEERLTTDVYPPDFGWTPDYRKPGERIDWWYHNMGSVTGAGVAEITNQLEFDDEVAAMASQKIYQLSRGLDDRPWALTVSFTTRTTHMLHAEILGFVRRLRPSGAD